MADLIPYAQRLVGQETINTVDGRDLHQFLEVTRDYSDWIRRQLQRARLVEHRDYTLVVTYISGRNIKEYFLTFDAAKHIGMLSNTDRGSQVREYFLECERRLQSTRTGLPTLHDPKLQMLLEAIVRMDAIEQQLQVASREAADAKDLATGIMRTQAWMTIRQYVFVHDLTRQMPLHVQQEYARWLGGYCLEHGYPMYKALTADRAWHDERTYYVGAIHDTLAGWLKRQGSSLALVPTRKEPGDVQT